MTTQNAAERRRYNLLKALQETDPECQILKDAIAPMEEAHNWEPRDPLLPGLMISDAMVFSSDPFTPDSLKESAAEQLVSWLIESNRQVQPEALIPGLWSVQETTRQNPQWGDGIARELARQRQWSEPVWKDIISGWRTADLQEEQYRKVLEWFSMPDVYTHHAGDIAESLHALTRNGGKSYAINLIDEAERVALPLWDHIRCDAEMPVQGWHEASFDFYQTGYLTTFWLESTAVRTRTSQRESFSPTCMRGLNQIVADGSLKGDLGSAVLAGQAGFLWHVDQPWAEETIQPIFTCGGNRERAAWGGLVEAQNITPQVAQALGPTFQDKFSELVDQPNNELRAKRLFADAYTKLLCHYAGEPREWLKETVKSSSKETAELVAEAMKNRLRETDAEQQKDWWDRWIKEYWQDRNMGSPKPISPSEGYHMVGWVPHLTEPFAEAVALAKATPWERLDIPFFVELNRSSAVLEHPDVVADLLIDLSEKSVVSMAWGEAIEVLEKIEETTPSKQTAERILDLKTRIATVIKSFQ